MRLTAQLRRLALPALVAIALSAPAVADPEASAALSPAMIDAGIDAQLGSAELKAQPRSADGEFLRRVTLDLAGRLPSRDELLGFLADSADDKRARAVDRLLGSEDHVTHLTDIWMDVLMSTQSGDRRPRNLDELREWVTEQVRKNVPYRVFVQRLVRAQGYVDENGAVAWSLTFDRDGLGLAASTARLFMGAQIECAQCHDHPFADWKQEQFLEMAAHFSRMEPRSKLRSEEEIAALLARARGDRRKILIQRAQRDLSVPGLFERASGELVVNERGEPARGQARANSKERITVKPEFLFEVKTRAELPDNRREAFALKLTSADNPYFARMGVNRIWSLMFGRGIVNPVDDLSDASVTTHPELLDELAAAWNTAGTDVRALLRSIALSEAYQRSSARPTGDVVDPESGAQDPLMILYGRMPVRPIGPLPLGRAVAGALVPEDNPQRGRVEQQLMRMFKGLAGERRLDLDRFEESLQEALFMQNSPLISNQNQGERSSSFVSWLLRTQPDTRERITRLTLRVLSRPPSGSELERMSAYVKAQEESTEAYEDLLWVLLNSSEFRYNH